MDKAYIETVRLLLEAAPHIFHAPCFALKGGTALNLFVHEMPRLSVDAKRRGVDVEVLLDKSQRTEKYSSADFVAHVGIPTFIDAVHAIAHNKVMVIDGETVVTGSFNFTKAAEDRNAENLLVIHDRAIAGEYRKNWEEHRGHSEGYSGN